VDLSTGMKTMSTRPYVITLGFNLTVAPIIRPVLN
jgi:hypothetical protein